MLVLRSPGSKLVFFSLEKGTAGIGGAQNFKEIQRAEAAPRLLPRHQTQSDLARGIPCPVSESPQRCCQAVPIKLAASLRLLPRASLKFPDSGFISDQGVYTSVSTGLLASTLGLTHPTALSFSTKITRSLRFLKSFMGSHHSQSKVHLHALVPWPSRVSGTSACRQGLGQTMFFPTSEPLFLLFSLFLYWLFPSAPSIQKFSFPQGLS